MIAGLEAVEESREAIFLILRMHWPNSKVFLDRALLIVVAKARLSVSLTR